MIKIYASILSLFILIQSFNLHLNAVDTMLELVEHANFHKENYGDSFYTFLSKHYGNLKESHQQQHQEEQEHQQHKCPFENDCQIHSAHVFVIEGAKCYILTTDVGLYNSLNYYHPNLFSNFEKQKIFQPPQLA